MATKILDTTTSDTGEVVNFSESDKKAPQGVAIGLDIGSGDTITLYTKFGDQAYRAVKTYTSDDDIGFVALPDSIRLDRTTDGGSADSTAYIIQVS